MSGRDRHIGRSLGLVGLLLTVVSCGHSAAQTADEAWDQGMYWYRRGKYAEAMAKFDDAYRRNPNDAKIILGQINAARELGNTALLKKEPADGERYHKYAIEKAVAAINNNPSDDRYYYALGQIYYERYVNSVAEFTLEQRGKYLDNALASFSKVMQHNPDPQNYYVHKYMGLLLVNRTKDDVPAGKEHLRKFLLGARGVLYEMDRQPMRSEEEAKERDRLRNEAEDVAAILKELP